MAGGRRGAGRTPPPRTFVEDGDRTSGGKSPTSCIGPKHVPLPEIPRDSDLLFELLMFCYTLAALFLQYLQLYRTIWWLPHSHNNYAMNFYLIDTNLVLFIGTVLGRRFLWTAVTLLCRTFVPNFLQRYVEDAMKVIVVTVVLSILAYCTYHIFLNHPLVNFFYLCYPISVYFILFWPDMLAFFTLIPSYELKAVQRAEDKRTRMTKPLFHSCTGGAEAIREEVECLKTDFNVRMKQVLFNSLLNAYYAGFVPCCFAQSALHYDAFWVTQHLGFVWISCFNWYIVQCYPPRYCDLLHKAALHLGKWIRVEGKTAHLPYTPWSSGVLWPHGSLVKYSREIFRAEGLSNAAVPGNGSHARFFMVFSNPATLVCLLLVVQVLLVFTQLAILMKSTEWQNIFSISLLLFGNYYTLFKLFRDYVIMWKVYRAEQLIQDHRS